MPIEPLYEVNMLHEQRVLGLADHIYDAVLDASRWPSHLHDLSEPPSRTCHSGVDPGLLRNGFYSTIEGLSSNFSTSK